MAAQEWREYLMKTLYDVLGALADDDAENIRAAFRKAVKAHHPDSNPDDPDAPGRFREIVRAHDILSDEQLRSAYDRLLEIAVEEQQQQLHDEESGPESNPGSHAVVRLANGAIAVTILLTGLVCAYVVAEYISGVSLLTPATIAERAPAPPVAAISPAVPGRIDPADPRGKAADIQTIDKPGDVQIADKPEDVQTAGKPEDVATVDTPKNVESPGKPENAATADAPRDVEILDKPEDVATVDKPGNGETADNPESPAARHASAPALAAAQDSTGSIAASVPRLGNLGAGDARFFRECGMLAYRNGDLTHALADFDLAISLDPDSPEAYIDRGIVRHRLGDLQGAFADVAQAKRIDDANRNRSSFAASHPPAQPSPAKRIPASRK